MEVSGLPGAVRTGVWLFPDAPSPAIVDAARAAEEAGLDEFWLGDEGVGRDPFGCLPPPRWSPNGSCSGSR